MAGGCGYTWSTELDALIRLEAAAAGVPLDLAYTFIAVESGFDPSARHFNPPIEDSVGLLQLNRIGGQGEGYTVEELMDPQRNLQIGLPPIAAAYALAWSPTIEPYEFIFQVATGSGHPGLVERSDPRIRRTFEIWVCFNSGAGFFGEGGAPSPVLVTGPGEMLQSGMLALLAPGMPIPPASLIAGHVGSVPWPILMVFARRILLQLTWRFGPRTMIRRQLYALSPAGLRGRFIAAIDPRRQVMRRLRLPYIHGLIRLPRRHHWPRF